MSLDLRRPRARRVGVVLAAATLAVAVPATAGAAPPYPSDSTAPDLIPLEAGYNAFWVSDGANDLHGTVRDARVLARDDQLVVWVNQHTTAKQQFKALQDSEYQNDTNTSFDQSVTLATGLGPRLGRIYAQGRKSGALRLTGKLINSETGTAGAYVSTSVAKAYYSHPRPYLPSDPTVAPVPGDDPGCAPSIINGSSQQAIRIGKPWADAKGNLLITRVAPVNDTTHQFSSRDVLLDPGYGTTGLCTGGSFPSGHTSTAYQAGLTLATLLPELAPEILTRASEAANNRLTLGVHYPLDLMGGRIAGEAALAARWTDPKYRAEVLAPARAELVRYLQKGCGHALSVCIARQGHYTSNPYGGRRMPGGTAQIVVDRRSAVRVYRERMTYGFPRVGSRLQPSVPARAANLLRTTFPRLTQAQRRSVLAQTEIASGYPLDRSGTPNGSWERLNLAAAMSATVRLTGHGSVRVVSTGGPAKVLPLRHRS